ncbi:hypothetical protein KVR01_009216 [Diaporthe batatas]|uniref:uncharacterized protein n=1 Tax=Diaporthe batatas TaxID=748121 RepID=UPI001D04F73B|nr:uncharacterized protein KVR01_009216 [Diaporthe batatas]KAG8160952.1 hypothetical protein KVR01_009216 [Diaporthe batatas]
MGPSCGLPKTPVVHDSRIYNHRVSWSRIESSGLPLFTILAHLTCFLPCISVWACFLSVLYFNITTDLSHHSHLYIASEPRPRSRSRLPSGRNSNPSKHRRNKGISHKPSSHLTSHHTYKMFGRSRKASVSQSTSKSSKPPSTAVTRDSGVSKRRPSTASTSRRRPSCSAQNLVDPSGNNSPIITLVVGREARIFAAHEEVLTKSPVLAAALRSQYMESTGKRLTLPDEEPEVLSPILEYLYKGDYSPRLIHNKRRDTWEIESNDEATIFHQATGAEILKDTVIYCAAEKYKLEELKRIALRKQGLRTGIPCGIILSSARFAYANTSDSDSKLRAHYLALIIRSRSTFKRSGTMQQEMFNGGSQLFFDLFVALANHVDDIQSPRGTPRSGTPKNGFF